MEKTFSDYIKKGDLVVTYGVDTIVLTKDSGCITLTKEQLAYLVESAIRNQEVIINVTPSK
jgi:uncharacterized membrane protein (Fun14 family)